MTNTISTYIRYRERVGRYVPFPPPLHSPKDDGRISLKGHAHLLLWQAAWPLWSALRGERWTRRPLMLIGCHNSGTTILARLIGNHRDIVNWSEAPEVWTPDDAFLSWGVLPETPLPLPFLFDLDSYVRTSAQHGQYIPQIQRSFSLFAALRLKRRFLNKNPHMAISVPYIEAAFPDACYIHIRRNGYAVVQSLVSNWRPILNGLRDGVQETHILRWSKLKEAIDPIYFDDPLALVRLCARYWQEMDQRAAEDLARLDKTRVYSTSYERLCNETETVLREMFTQFDLNPAHYDWEQLRQPTRYPWTDMLPMDNRNFKYRERLTPAEIHAISDEVGETLAEYGYEVERPPL